MIGLLIPLVARLGVAGRFQRLAAWLVAFALLIAVLALLWWQFARWVDRQVDAGVAADRSAATIEVLDTQVAADRAAGAALRNRADAFTDSQANLEDAADAALANHTSPLDAVLDGMRAKDRTAARDRRRP